jgi:hypothetical protein
MRSRHPAIMLGVALLGGVIGSACTPDTAPGDTPQATAALARGSAATARQAGYATMHDTMPEDIHYAKHAAVERPAAEIPRSKTAEAFATRLERIPGTKDAWLSFTLRRRIDGDLATRADTVTLLMNCNADSLLVLDRQGQALAQRLVLAPGRSLTFATNASHRIRVFGLRPVQAGQRSESLVRLALGGDLVVRTPVD